MVLLKVFSGACASLRCSLIKVALVGFCLYFQTMASVAPEPYRYITNLRSMCVHKVLVGSEEPGDSALSTACQWRFVMGSPDLVWGRSVLGSNRCPSLSGF